MREQRGNWLPAFCIQKSKKHCFEGQRSTSQKRFLDPKKLFLDILYVHYIKNQIQYASQQSKQSAAFFIPLPKRLLLCGHTWRLVTPKAGVLTLSKPV